MDSNHRGSGLLAVLIFAATTLSTILIWNSLVDKAQKHAEYFNTYHPVKNKNVQEAIEAWQRSDISPNQKYFCHQTLHPGSEIIRSACERNQIPFNENMEPMAAPSDAKQYLSNIDFNILLSSAGKCTESTPISETTLRNRRLGPDSLRSNSTCNQDMSFIGKGNISQDTIILDATPPLLSAAGYIEATILQLNQNSLIAAYGDVLIDRVVAEQPVMLTVISLSGLVHISEISGPVLLRIVANKESSVPLQNLSTANILFPPLITHQLEAITSGNVATQ